MKHLSSESRSSSNTHIGGWFWGQEEKRGGSRSQVEPPSLCVGDAAAQMAAVNCKLT